MRNSEKNLFLVFSRLVVDDGEVSQFVGVLVAGDHMQVVAKLLLLQVLLSEVLEVSLGEGSLGGYRDTCLEMHENRATSPATDFPLVVNQWIEEDRTQGFVGNWLDYNAGEGKMIHEFVCH